MTKTFCGSYLYASPELAARGGYNPAANDMWSYGVILYIMIYNTFPYGERHVEKLVQKAKAKQVAGKPRKDKNGRTWTFHQYHIGLPTTRKITPEALELLSDYLFVKVS